MRYFYLRGIKKFGIIKREKGFFQIVFIAQIQVAQQYSSLTTQNNSMAVTRKARIHEV